MTIKGVMTRELGHIKMDKKFAKEFNKFVMGVFYKNKDHIEFMGSPLLGVYRVTFDRGDLNFFWDSILNADRVDVEQALWDLKSVNKEWKVGGNVTNHALMYLLYRAFNSDMPDKEIDRFALDVLMLIQFKFITTSLSEDFRYLANKDIAVAAYNNLSRRFLIKQVDSWGEFMRVRATTMLQGTNQRKDLRGIITAYNDDKAIVGVITGISSNLNDSRVEYNRAFYSVKESGTRLSRTSRFGVDREGELVLLDSTKSLIKYTQYVRDNITHKSTFINSELIEILMTGTALNPKIFKEVLEYLSDNYGKRKYEYLTDFISSLMTFGLHTLSRTDTELKDLGSVHNTLRGAVTSRLAVDADLESFKKLGRELVISAVGERGDIDTLRNNVLYYIIIWALMAI